MDMTVMVYCNVPKMLFELLELKEVNGILYHLSTASFVLDPVAHLAG